MTERVQKRMTLENECKCDIFQNGQKGQSVQISQKNQEDDDVWKNQKEWGCGKIPLFLPVTRSAIAVVSLRCRL